MAEETDPGFDPRFDPAFQRGYQPAAGERPRVAPREAPRAVPRDGNAADSPSAAARTWTADDDADVADAVVEAVAVADVEAEGAASREAADVGAGAGAGAGFGSGAGAGAGAEGGRWEQAPSLIERAELSPSRNRYVAAIWAIGIGFIVLGVVLYVFSVATSYTSPNTGNPDVVQLVLSQLGWMLASPLIMVGLATMVAMLFLHALRMRRG